MKQSLHNKQVVTVGGGTGTYPVVASLRELVSHITCIVAVSDSGGSSARLRDEFGFPPVGDLRQSLTALANPTSQELIQQLLLYRFSKGKELLGHNLGNLLLTALQDMMGSTTAALRAASTLFMIPGSVVPITEDSVDLKIEYQNGSSIIGEHFLDEPTAPMIPIKKISLLPKPKTNPMAIESAKTADHIIIGPGDLYASILSVLVAPRFSSSIKHSSAKITYIVNIMTRRSQTAHMSASDHVKTIEKQLGKQLDTIILNFELPDQEALHKYTEQNEQPVPDDLGNDSRVIRAPLLTKALTAQQKGDKTPRSVLRHDSRKLQKVLKKVLRQ